MSRKLFLWFGQDVFVLKRPQTDNISAKDRSPMSRQDVIKPF